MVVATVLARETSGMGREQLLGVVTKQIWEFVEQVRKLLLQGCGELGLRRLGRPISSGRTMLSLVPLASGGPSWGWRRPFTF